jgi:hypothetical protein
VAPNFANRNAALSILRLQSTNERRNMVCQDIAYTRSFYMGLISAEGLKQEHFK